MKPSHHQTEAKYKDIRSIAMEAVQKRLPYADRPKIKLSKIDHQALTEVNSWESLNRSVQWPWETGYHEYSAQNPKRFELAIWHDKTLCSLSLGRPNASGSRLRLEFTEARPLENPLKGRIMPIVLSVAEVYGGLLGADEVRLIDPIDQKLVDYYSSFGYEYNDGKAEKTIHYLVKRLS